MRRANRVTAGTTSHCSNGKRPIPSRVGMLGAYVHRPTAIAHSSNTTVTASPTAIHTAVGASTRGANGQEAQRNASAATTYAAEAITTSPSAPTMQCIA